MQNLDIHTIISVVTSLLMIVAVWWKVSKDTEINRKTIEQHAADIANLQTKKTDVEVTAKLISAIDKIERELSNHYTDFKLHRTEDSERRMSDLMVSVSELAKENRADHRYIMDKLGVVGQRDDKE